MRRTVTDYRSASSFLEAIETYGFESQPHHGYEREANLGSRGSD